MRYSLVVQHAEGLGRHAVDAPVRVPVLVAYRDREPAVVRPYQVDQFSLAALDLQRLALAGVCGVVPLCNRERRDGRFSSHQRYVTYRYTISVPFGPVSWRYLWSRVINAQPGANDIRL